MDIAGIKGCEGDPLYFLTNQHYLSRQLSWRQRIASVIRHYRHEQQHWTPDYHELVYRSSGLPLWEQVVGGVRYTVRLELTQDVRTEGELSVLLHVDDVRVCWIGFTYVDAELFGKERGLTMLISRCQTHRNPALNQFRASFKQNSPPFFGLATILGIARLSGIKSIYGIKHDAQIAYQDRYRDGFINSYDNFWLKLGGEPADQQAFRMSVPLTLTPVTEVKHKARAVARRAFWADVEASAHASLLPHVSRRDPLCAGRVELVTATASPPR